MPANPAAQSSASPLPLQPLHLPDPPGFWPPAPGWWLLAGVILILIILLWLLVRYQRRLRYRRAALQELRALEQGDCSDRLLLARLSTLLRRAALQAFPDSGCAGLQGDEWLMFLDARLKGEKPFSRGAGQCLGAGPYQRDPEVNRAELLNLCRRWLAGLPAEGRDRRGR